MRYVEQGELKEGTQISQKGATPSESRVSKAQRSMSSPKLIGSGEKQGEYSDEERQPQPRLARGVPHTEKLQVMPRRATANSNVLKTYNEHESRNLANQSKHRVVISREIVVPAPSLETRQGQLIVKTLHPKQDRQNSNGQNRSMNNSNNVKSQQALLPHASQSYYAPISANNSFVVHQSRNPATSVSYQ